MGNVDITPESLDTAGGGIESVAEQFRDALQRFSDRIAGVGDACGGDEMGGLIGDAHQEVFTFAMECFEDAAESIAEAGADIKDFAKSYSDTDDEIAQIFGRLNAEIGG